MFRLSDEAAFIVKEGTAVIHSLFDVWTVRGFLEGDPHLLCSVDESASDYLNCGLV
jgi:hypothetical protein